MPATKKKPRKKKAPASDVNRGAWVTEPEAAPEGHPFCDVAFEHRLHTEPITVLGVKFVPGQIVTYRSLEDVPAEFFEHPELKLTAVQFGVCRIDDLFRYTSLTAHTIKALYRATGVAVPVPFVVDPKLAPGGPVTKGTAEAFRKGFKDAGPEPIAEEVAADSDQPEGGE